MNTLPLVLRQLQQERDRLATELQRLNTAISALSGRAVTIRRTRRLSAAGRARIAAAQRARWARAKGRKVVSIAGRRRSMSAAARKRIAAAQKARWAKWRAKR
jgi:hypothetical protein